MRITKLFNKTVLLVVCAVIVFAGISAIGAAEKLHEAKVQTAQAAKATQEHDKLVNEVKSLQASTKQLENEATQYSAYYHQTCDWVRSVVPKYRIAIPPLCQTNH